MFRFPSFKKRQNKHSYFNRKLLNILLPIYAKHLYNVVGLVARTFRDHCIVFIQTKKQAHRMHIVLGLLGVNVGELHGNLSQAQVLTIYLY